MAPSLMRLAACFWLIQVHLALCESADCHQMAGGAAHAAHSECAAAVCCASDVQHHMSAQRWSTARICVLPLTSVQRANALVAGDSERAEKMEQMGQLIVDG